MKLMARAGETVTCENGHPICDVAIDIFSEEIVRPSQFSNWRDLPEPNSGDRVAPCPHCGAQFIGRKIMDSIGPLELVSGFGLHIGDKWRGFGNYAE